MSDWEGLLLVDKPEGPTSHDVVARVRRLTRQRRIGHTGTLDPMATGLLALMLGRTTRLLRYLPQGPKVYEGRFRLGLVTDSDDITGAVLERHTGELPAPELVARHASTLLGTLEQHPPAVSARKVDGQRLYKLARAGKFPSTRAATVEVYSFHVEPDTPAGDYRFRVSVSAGTYVRALARDLGRMLGCGATLATLRRTEIGPLELAQAVAPDALDDLDSMRQRLIAPEQIPLSAPTVALDDDGESRVRRGQVVQRDLPGSNLAGPCRLIGPSGRLIGIGELDGALVRPRVVLLPA